MNLFTILDQRMLSPDQWYTAHPVGGRARCARFRRHLTEGVTSSDLSTRRNRRRNIIDLLALRIGRAVHDDFARVLTWGAAPQHVDDQCEGGLDSDESHNQRGNESA